MTLIEQVATYLQDTLSLGTIGTNIFINRLPDSPAAAIAVIDTGGAEPDTQVPVKRPTFQVLLRNTNYDNAKAVLNSVRDGLHNKFPGNSTTGLLTAGGTHILSMMAISEGGSIGQDEAGRDLMSINFICKTR